MKTLTDLQNRIYLLKTEILTRSRPAAGYPFKENEKELKEKKLKELETELLNLNKGLPK